jgi:hypothetical protein
MTKLIGTGANQVPTNADLGKLAYQDAIANGTGTAGQVLQSGGATGSPTWATVSSNPYTAQSTAATGYITLVGGLIIQWGKTVAVGGGGNSVTATFAITFPNAVHSVTTSKGNGAAIDNGAFSTTSAQFYNNGGMGNATPIYYIAIGH